MVFHNISENGAVSVNHKFDMLYKLYEYDYFIQILY